MTSPPTFQPGQTPTAEQLQALGSEVTAYTPTLTGATTNPNLGTSPTAAGMWLQNGSLAMVWFSIVFGTGGSVDPGAGNYRLSLPVDAVIGALNDLAVGSGRATDSSDSSAAGSALVGVELAPGFTDRVRFTLDEGGTVVTGAAPWTWAAGDRLFGFACYPGDF